MNRTYDRLKRYTAAALTAATLSGGVLVMRAGADEPVAAEAAASGKLHHRSREHLATRIDAALKAAGATDAQRATIDAARDRALSTLAELRQSRRAELERGLQLFSAQEIDPAALTELRVERSQRAAQARSAIEQAIVVAHDTLTPAQRQALVSSIEARRSERSDRAAGGHADRRITRRMNALLDTAQATPEQRQAITAAVQNVLDLMQQTGNRADFQQTLALFQGDHLDASALANLRAARQAQHERVEDAVAGALRTVHDTLTPAQRQVVVAHLRQRLARHRG